MFGMALAQDGLLEIVREGYGEYCIQPTCRIHLSLFIKVVPRAQILLSATK